MIVIKVQDWYAFSPGLQSCGLPIALDSLTAHRVTLHDRYRFAHPVRRERRHYERARTSV